MHGLLRKAEAVYATRRGTRFSTRRPVERPRHIQIEPTVRCNLHCITCTRDQVIDTYKKVDMTLDDIATILRAFPQLASVKFQGLGEPLLAKNIEAMLQAFHARGVRLSTISNGTLFHKERYRRLVLDYFRSVHVSIDATDPALFSTLRVGGSLEQVQDGLRRLAADRDATNRRLSLGINFVVSHENYRDLPALYAVAVDSGVDFVSVPTVENWTVPGEDGHARHAAYAQEAARHAPAIREAVLHLKGRLRRKGILLSYRSGDRRLGRCYWPFASVFVTVEGYVTPCCIRMHRAHALGNLFDAGTFDDIWQGDAYRALRDAHRTGDHTNALCGTCPI